jgi:hypothetical protein
MSRTAVKTRDTPKPGAVTAGCDRCGEQFVTDESTAYDADQNDEDLLCKACENGQPAPPSKVLEQPEIDAIREDVLYRDSVGPDAEPPVEASVPDSVGFGDLDKMSFVEVSVSKGTTSLGPVTVALGDTGDRGLSLPVSLEPSTAIYDEAVQDAIVSALSRRTQLLIDLKGTEGDR